MGDLTSTNTPIIIPPKHPISVCNPFGPQRHSGPSAYKNHLRFNAQKEKATTAWLKRTRNAQKLFCLVLSHIHCVTQ